MSVDPAKLRELAETQIALVARVHLRAAADEIERLRERLRVASVSRHIAICPHGDIIELPCELEEELVRLRADSERLDWLEKRTAQGLTPMMQQTSQLLFHWSGYGPLRAAIDAARREEA